MFVRRARPILGACCALALMGITACGQRGDLYLPTEAAATGRATLPEALRISPTAPAPGSTIAAPSASPAARNPPSAPEVKP